MTSKRKQTTESKPDSGVKRSRYIEDRDVSSSTDARSALHGEESILASLEDIAGDESDSEECSEEQIVGIQQLSTTRSKKYFRGFTQLQKKKSYYVGDVVLLKQPNDNTAPHEYVAQIDEIFQERRSNQFKMTVVWFYRDYDTFKPEQENRNFNCQPNEIYYSYEYDVNEPSTVLSKIKVVNAAQNKIPQYLEHDKFYCRYRYDPRSNKLTPIKSGVSWG